MNKQKVGDVKKVLSPVIKLAPYVKAVWVENNAISILVDDNLETKQYQKKLQKLIEKIKLKVNQPRNLTMWWELVRMAEPKALEELKNLTIIYDQCDYVKLFKSMIEKGCLFPSNRKADMLFERAKRHLDRSEEILLNDISQEIYLAMTEVAQSLLLYLGRFSPTPKDVLISLDILSKKDDTVRRSLYNSYKEIYEEVNHISEGKVKEFSARDAGYFISKAKSFMFDMEDTVTFSERDRSGRMMYEAYNFSLRMCEMALRSNMKVLPLRDDEKINSFKKHYIDNGLVHPSHFETLTALYQYSAADRKTRLNLVGNKCLDKIRIKNLGLAMQDVLK